jgi:hypothetical protein
VKAIYKDVEQDLHRTLNALKRNPFVCERSKSNSYYAIDKALVKVHHWFETYVDKKRSSWFNDDSNYTQIIGRCSDWKGKLDTLAGDDAPAEEMNKSIAFTLCRINEVADSSVDALWDGDAKTTILMHFAKRGNLDATSLLLDAGANVNAQDKAGFDSTDASNKERPGGRFERASRVSRHQDKLVQQEWCHCATLCCSQEENRNDTHGCGCR